MINPVHVIQYYMFEIPKVVDYENKKIVFLPRNDKLSSPTSPLLLKIIDICNAQLSF